MSLSSEELIARIETDVKEIKTSLASFREEWMKDQFNLRNDINAEQNQITQRFSLLEIEQNSLKLRMNDQDTRIKSLEHRPLKTWDGIKSQLIGLIISGVGGALLGFILSHIFK